MSELRYRFVWLQGDDRTAWDDFASNHEQSDFCQSWQWGDLKARGEWQVHRAGLFDGDRLASGAQVLVRPLPLRLGKLAYISRGPLVNWTDSGGAHERAALLDGLEGWARRLGAVSLKVDPCVGAKAQPYLSLCRLRQAPVDNPDFGGTQPRYVMRLDLRPGADAVFANFKADYRNRIRKAERRGLTVRVSREPVDWQSWYQLLLETAKRQEFRVRAYEYFDAMRDGLSGPCVASLYLAEREGRQVGGILCVGYGRTVWYLYGAMNDEGRENYSGYLLQWEAIRAAIELGCETYDFRGVGPFDQPEGPHYGLNRFKAGFSPAEVEWVGEWDLILAPWRYELFKRAMAWRARRR